MATSGGAHIPAGPAWRDKPQRFVEPPLVTNQEIMGFKQGIGKELRTTHAAAEATLTKLGHDVVDKPNSYWSHFKKDGDGPLVKEHRWTYDRVNDDTEYDQNVPRDTFHTMHSEAARKKCKVPLTTRKQLRTSQNYGWLPAIDEPNNGYGRSSIFLDSAMDKSHLRVGGPWSAR
mmetsp:Transcript_14398/g.36304  ORF Transcript_14398/g.36304 Transcript_14398/m.36304 type:complete len:174 (+) Transcript_14398:85-606(+)